ncbi:MAG: hypothetical protein QOE16_1694 [Microbacteriaceae bacterium]|nr:hypothetical protein [Microbacteriaceae bacterium]
MIGESLLGCLFRNRHARANLAPRLACIPRLVHEVPDEGVGILIEPCSDVDGVDKVGERPTICVNPLDVGDQALEWKRRRRHTPRLG